METMSIEKKSLISTLKTTKRANVASAPVPAKGLSSAKGLSTTKGLSTVKGFSKSKGLSTVKGFSKSKGLTVRR
jgi:hypothetical protein